MLTFSQNPIDRGVIYMRIKIMPLPSTIQMGQKKRTTSAAVSTTCFGPNSLKPQGDSLENTAKKNSSILREKNYRKIAETLYKTGVITMATFDRECNLGGKDRKYLRHIFSLLLSEKIKSKQIRITRKKKQNK